GSKPYVISFNVINESAITHFIPYPNPCTNSMRFVFTVTGAQTPDQILVKIMTVTGKVVREISAAEFGPVHIGNNTSQFVWDGTDQYGDRLANGVYLYQVQVRANGVAIKHRSSELDKYFSNNTGKIYLMR
ncbi:MAG: T9SS type A sorting domain-containing protein, partial [Bacteroidia bacterium]|nr:T9SS type A sorting domain-containing protein [Bacteroidia bacterium]